MRNLRKDAIEPVADAERLLVRLEVDVGNARVDGVDQDLLNVADDGRVFDLGRLLVVQAGRDAALLEVDLQVVHALRVLQRRARRLEQLVNRVGELVVLDDDRLDDEVGLEANFLQRLQVGGIGGRDVQAVAALVQRQHPARLGDLDVHQVFPDLAEVERREVHQGNAECARRKRGKLGRRKPLALDQLLDEGDISLLRLRLERLGIAFRHQPVLREGAREPAQVARGGGLCGHGKFVSSGALCPEKGGSLGNQAICVPRALRMRHPHLFQSHKS